MLNVGRLWLGSHSFVGVPVTVELGYEVDGLLALRQSEDIIGPSGEPLELVGALETDIVFREMDHRQSVWVVRGRGCDCLVGRDVLLGCTIISDDAVFSTLCIACTAVGCFWMSSYSFPADSDWTTRLEAEDQSEAQRVHVPFDRGRLHFYIFFLRPNQKNSLFPVARPGHFSPKSRIFFFENVRMRIARI